MIWSLTNVETCVVWIPDQTSSCSKLDGFGYHSGLWLRSYDLIIWNRSIISALNQSLLLCLKSDIGLDDESLLSLENENDINTIKENPMYKNLGDADITKVMQQMVGNMGQTSKQKKMMKKKIEKMMEKKTDE